MSSHKPSRAKVIASCIDSHVLGLRAYFENKPSGCRPAGDEIAIGFFGGYVLEASAMLVELAEAYEKAINDCANALKAAEAPSDDGNDVINLEPVWLALEASPGFESPYETGGN